MPDGGVIVGYLTAYLLKGARQLADRSFEALLERLVNRVEERIGHRPISTLEANAGDERAEHHVRQQVERAMQIDPAFARELAGLVRALDERGGQHIVNQVYAQSNVQSFGGGFTAGRDLFYAKVPDPTDLSEAPGWAKAFILLGAVLAIGAFGLFGYTLFTHNPDLNDPNFGDPPPGIARAALVFFIGFILLGIGAFGRAMSKRP